MDKSESFLYLEIAESIRRLIVSGELKSGDRLPPVRELARQWACTPGTVNRAYAELAREGLVVSHRGSGTRVSASPLQPEAPAWRWASLVNRAEKFLLDALSGGNTPAQAEAALSVAIARWRDMQAAGVESPAAKRESPALRFAGSHDLVVESLVRLLGERTPGFSLGVEYVGSLGGLMALARREADIAGVHLWDAETDTYNAPFVRRVLPGRRVALVNLAYRSLGLILPPGNPQGLRALADLARPGVRLVNRQPGSGTRVWLDAKLKALGIVPERIAGYDRTELTHLAVALAVSRGEATVGLGIQAAANAYGLDFVALTREQYDLAFPEEVWGAAHAKALVEVIRSAHFREVVLALGGYDPSDAGRETWLT